MALVGKNPFCNAGSQKRHHRFDPWVGKISWRRKWQPTLVFVCDPILFYFLKLFIIIGGQWLYNTVVVFPYIDMNRPGVYMCPHPDPPTSLPHPIPQGHPSAPALSTLYHASNLDCRSVSHVIIYMFQCYCLKASHPLLLPLSPKVCSLPLCLFCCLTLGSLLPSF